MNGLAASDLSPGTCESRKMLVGSPCRFTMIPGLSKRSGFGLIVGVLLLLAAPPETEASEIVREVHSAALQTTFEVTCNDGPLSADYVAETNSGVPLDQPYAVRRGANKGLVVLEEGEGRERRVKSYIVPRGSVRGLVSVKENDTSLPDRLDLVFTADGLRLIYTFNADGGIFTMSEVYLLPFGRTGVDRRVLGRDHSDVGELLEIGLPAYDIVAGRCNP